ncbi:phosphatidylinositol 4-kinase beta [Prorops nasuta]|uniref:phosphatidylinositol 4-kinase beta n=1 Tax=Prorops nasuta TaxID=863751 RepID=UPI0034CF9ED5
MSEVVATTVPTGGTTRQESAAHINMHKLANCNFPLVHGRPDQPINVRNRLTTHQRNHSLDFRSMGILLHPVPQTCTTPLIIHHRNRSLDSALQRIPEVDVTPSPECENPTPVVKSVHVCKGQNRERDDLASLGSDDSGILCGSDSGSSDTANVATRESSVDHLHSRESLDSTFSQAGDMDSVDVVDGESVLSVSPLKLVLYSEPLPKENAEGESSKVEKSVCKTLDMPNGIINSKDLQNSTYLRVDPCSANSVSERDYTSTMQVTVQRELSGAAMTLCCGTATQSEEKPTKKVEIRTQETVQPKPAEGCLLRLFESQHFDIFMEISYLFNYSEELGVLSYLANKMFSFQDSDVDFYLLQLVLMYIHIPSLSEVLRPYLIHRCKQSADFSLKCAWLLEAYSSDVPSTSKKRSIGTNFKELILSDELRPKGSEIKKQRSNDLQVPVALPPNSVQNISSPNKKAHHRSQSDATGLFQSSRYTHSGTINKVSLGNLSSGRAFDNGCTCFDSCQGVVNDLRGKKTDCFCNAPRLDPERKFIEALISIGKLLGTIPTKESKIVQLVAELNTLNLNLPARVWLPLHSSVPHHIVRVPPQYAAVLNSKDKAPYIIYVEVLEVDDLYTSPIPTKIMGSSLRHTKSEENLIGGEQSNTNFYNISSEKQKNITPVLRQTPVKNASPYSTRSTDIAFNDDDSNDIWRQGENRRGPVFVPAEVKKKLCEMVATPSATFNHDPEDPSAAVLKEPWELKQKRIKASSPYGHLASWKVLAVIVKCGDDLRQELLAMQLLEMLQKIWQDEKVRLWVRPYKILCLSNDSGLIEPIMDTISLHQFKKHCKLTLLQYFERVFGPMGSEAFKKAQRNFVESCAAYCLFSYIIQVKDRHNGNILLHSDGHLIHIDFGFILSNSPKNLGFESSPFKLTPEFVEVMGGSQSEVFMEFKNLIVQGLIAARKHSERITNLVEIMLSASQLPCFRYDGEATVQRLKNRVFKGLTEDQFKRHVDDLVKGSIRSWSTKLYDRYQYFANGTL